MMMFDAAQIPEKLVRYLGLKEDAQTFHRIPELWQTAVSLTQPATFRQEMDITKFHAQFSPYTENSRAVNRLLNGCCNVVLLVTSIGPDLELASRDHRKKHQLFEGYIFDRMGSFMAESLMRTLDHKVTSDCEKIGHDCTIRYSPGYQDFPLECQKIFVRLAASDIPYLRIDPDYRLIPEKTVTAIKGIL